MASFAASPEFSPDMNEGNTPGAPPSERDIISAPLSTHQSIASETPSSSPCPSLLSAVGWGISPYFDKKD